MRVIAALAVAAAAGAAAAALPSWTGGDGVAVAYFPNVGHAIPIVAFADGAPQAEPRVFDSGPQAVEALFAGSVQMAYVGPGPALTAFANSGGDITILSGAAAGGASMVARPGAYGDAAALAESCPGPGCAEAFDGRRVAAPQIGNTQDVSLRHLVGSYGLQTAERWQRDGPQRGKPRHLHPLCKGRDRRGLGARAVGYRARARPGRRAPL